ncbi:MAG TPA: DUF3604 domain-containing protein [Candidatus Bathyarchaeia archaeon]|nr:DUF3604 domain-containing protein [Candidatus Bathyarchaeia archaeon]
MRHRPGLVAGLCAVIAISTACEKKPEAAPHATNASSSTQPADARLAPNPLRNAYFGDLHLHTSYSMDAFAFGTRTTPEDSYRYAQGESVEYMGNSWKRNVPLDFLAVTDHAEYLGTVRESISPNGPFAKSEWFTTMTSTDPRVSGAAFQKLLGSTMINKPIAEFNQPDLLRSAWQTYSAMADKYYQPGKFTTFIGFEWTSMPQAQNLHRCVIFEGKGPDSPYTAFQSVDPEDLWRYLEAQRKQGLDVIAVPHNGNVSNGLMFATRDLSGKPLTKEYAELRMLNEPLAEIMQAKGQSDTSPALSPTDEFADFEIWKYKLDGSGIANSATGSYIRQAFGVGQELHAKIGANPFKFGIEAGTDFHSGIDSTEPSNYAGSHGNQDSNPRAVIGATKSVVGEPPTALSSGGLTGVWAEENTRESIFAAFKRKETFGTSGVRIKVRMFAGWNYPSEMTKNSDWIKMAYDKGVPMGGDLSVPAGSKAPTFVVHAVKDPESGNLDRIQIIKIVTKNGKSHEEIYDVVWSGDRKSDPKTGKISPVGNTVDVKSATYTNSIGAAELLGEWTDTDFDPNAYATYYARVLEIPTPRWSTYWAAKLNLPPNRSVPATDQQRAWTSPIWYTPPGAAH